jgi:FkbM family methyltransferase
MTWVSYAQNFEDVLLMRALAQVERGVYVDVGANDPRADSVTRAFYERGWRGVNIEPVPYWFERLQADRPGDVNLCVAAGAAPGAIDLYEVVGTGLTTSDAQHAARHAERGLEVRALHAPVRTLDDILREHALQVVHFLKIDVEGAEESVLRGIDLERVRPWIVLVESSAPMSTVQVHGAWEHLLMDHGYLFAWFDGLNRFYVAHEHARLVGALAIPPNVFDDFMRYTERLLRDGVADCQVLLERERDRAARAEAALQEVLNTLSWRVTAPLRWLRARLRKRRGDASQAPSPSPASRAGEQTVADAPVGAPSVPPDSEAGAAAGPASACVEASPLEPLSWSHAGLGESGQRHYEVLRRAFDEKRRFQARDSRREVGG